MTQKNKVSFQQFSVSKKLREQNKSNDYLELMISNLSLEELISLKLEICTKTVGIALYGFPIWKSLSYIVKDAVIKFAISVTNSKIEASRFLGISRQELDAYLKRQDVKDFFN